MSYTDSILIINYLTQLAYPGYHHSDYQCIKKLMVHNIFFLCGNH